jgi:hypothetical protein
MLDSKLKNAHDVKKYKLVVLVVYRFLYLYQVILPYLTIMKRTS